MPRSPKKGEPEGPTGLSEEDELMLSTADDAAEAASSVLAHVVDAAVEAAWAVQRDAAEVHAESDRCLGEALDALRWFFVRPDAGVPATASVWLPGSPVVPAPEDTWSRGMVPDFVPPPPRPASPASSMPSSIPSSMPVESDDEFEAAAGMMRPASAAALREARGPGPKTSASQPVLGTVKAPAAAKAKKAAGSKRRGSAGGAASVNALGQELTSKGYLICRTPADVDANLSASRRASRDARRKAAAVQMDYQIRMEHERQVKERIAAQERDRLDGLAALEKSMRGTAFGYSPSGRPVALRRVKGDKLPTASEPEIGISTQRPARRRPATAGRLLHTSLSMPVLDPLAASFVPTGPSGVQKIPKDKLKPGVKMRVLSRHGAAAAAAPAKTKTKVAIKTGDDRHDMPARPASAAALWPDPARPARAGTPAAGTASAATLPWSTPSEKAAGAASTGTLPWPTPESRPASSLKPSLKSSRSASLARL